MNSVEKIIVWYDNSEVNNQCRMLAPLSAFKKVFGEPSDKNTFAFGIGITEMNAKMSCTLNFGKKVEKCIAGELTFPKGLMQGMKRVYGTDIECINVTVPSEHRGTYMYALQDEMYVYVFINDEGPIAMEMVDLNDTLEEMGEDVYDEVLSDVDNWEIQYDAHQKKLIYKYIEEDVAVINGLLRIRN